MHQTICLRSLWGKFLPLAALGLFTGFTGLASPDEPKKKDAHGKDPASAVFIPGLGDMHHPVSTKNPQAQKFFDQGMQLLYGFNHDEARKAFAQAARLDPQMAMAHWGMALAVGPNYNLDAEEAQLRDAYQSIRKALKLAKGGPPQELAYIKALARRYAADPGKADKKKQALAYKNAMATVVKAYPDDLDAATLYAESLMNLMPWNLWTHAGAPTEYTPEILQVLESVLARNPNHTGANHLYIHAIEASPFPERGLPSAERLKTLAPNAGHLVHMPSHIFIRVGDYTAAAHSNEKAVAVDRAYVAKFKPHGAYPMMYYPHNMHFLAVANVMRGRHKDAKKAAHELVDHVGPFIDAMPMLEFFMPTPILVQIRFQKWDEILKSTRPDPKMKGVLAVWQFGRGLAYLAQQKIDLAEQELTDLRKTLASIPDDAMFGQVNKTRIVMTIPEKILAAKIAHARGDLKSATKLLEDGAAIEDDLKYIEPADWYLPARETLGAMLLDAKQPEAAEKVFRADLLQHRRNPRSLFGLMKSLEAQGKTYAASQIRQQFEAAWKHADAGKLRTQDF